MARVLHHDRRGERGVGIHGAARECHEGQPALLQELPQRRRAGPERGEEIGAELDAAEPDAGDILDRLEVVAAPGDRRVAEADVGRGPGHRPVEAGEVDRGVERGPPGETEPVEREPEADGGRAQPGHEVATRRHGSRYRAGPRGAPPYCPPAGTITVTPAQVPPPGSA